MTPADLLTFVRRSKLAVVSTTSAAGAPQAAVVGIAVTDALEIVFDTLETSRKAVNLRRDPRIALVIGWDEEQTVQCEGIADEPAGAGAGTNQGGVHRRLSRRRSRARPGRG